MAQTAGDKYLAYFSTDGGRTAPRAAAIGEVSTIVRSDPKADAIKLVHQLRLKWPHVCYAIFAPWKIYWFFDEHDFRLQGGRFLYEEVLSRMQKQNEEILANFCKEWSDINQTYFHLVKELPPEQLFHEKEWERYGQGFLEQAKRLMCGSFDRALSIELHEAKLRQERDFEARQKSMGRKRGTVLAQDLRGRNVSGFMPFSPMQEHSSSLRNQSLTSPPAFLDSPQCFNSPSAFPLMPAPAGNLINNHGQYMVVATPPPNAEHFLPYPNVPVMLPGPPEMQPPNFGPPQNHDAPFGHQLDLTPGATTPGRALFVPEAALRQPGGFDFLRHQADDTFNAADVFQGGHYRPRKGSNAKGRGSGTKNARRSLSMQEAKPDDGTVFQSPEAAKGGRTRRGSGRRNTLEKHSSQPSGFATPFEKDEPFFESPQTLRDGSNPDVSKRSNDMAAATPLASRHHSNASASLAVTPPRAQGKENVHLDVPERLRVFKDYIGPDVTDIDTVFVKLPNPNLTEEEVRDMLGHIGPIRNVNTSRGYETNRVYAFYVRFNSVAEVRKAIAWARTQPGIVIGPPKNRWNCQPRSWSQQIKTSSPPSTRHTNWHSKSYSSEARTRRGSSAASFEAAQTDILGIRNQDYSSQDVRSSTEPPRESDTAAEQKLSKTSQESSSKEAAAKKGPLPPVTEHPHEGGSEKLEPKVEKTSRPQETATAEDTGAAPQPSALRPPVVVQKSEKPSDSVSKASVPKPSADEQHPKTSPKQRGNDAAEAQGTVAAAEPTSGEISRQANDTPSQQEAPLKRGAKHKKKNTKKTTPAQTSAAEVDQAPRMSGAVHNSSHLPSEDKRALAGTTDDENGILHGVKQGEELQPAQFLKNMPAAGTAAHVDSKIAPAVEPLQSSKQQSVSPDPGQNASASKQPDDEQESGAPTVTDPDEDASVETSSTTPTSAKPSRRPSGSLNNFTPELKEWRGDYDKLMALLPTLEWVPVDQTDEWRMKADGHKRALEQAEELLETIDAKLEGRFDSHNKTNRTKSRKRRKTTVESHQKQYEELLLLLNHVRNASEKMSKGRPTRPYSLKHEDLNDSSMILLDPSRPRQCSEPSKIIDASPGALRGSMLNNVAIWYGNGGEDNPAGINQLLGIIAAAERNDDEGKRIPSKSRRKRLYGRDDDTDEEDINDIVSPHNSRKIKELRRPSSSAAAQDAATDEDLAESMRVMEVDDDEAEIATVQSQAKDTDVAKEAGLTKTEHRSTRSTDSAKVSDTDSASTLRSNDEASIGLGITANTMDGSKDEEQSFKAKSEGQAGGDSVAREQESSRVSEMPETEANVSDSTSSEVGVQSPRQSTELAVLSPSSGKVQEQMRAVTISSPSNSTSETRKKEEEKPELPNTREALASPKPPHISVTTASSPGQSVKSPVSSSPTTPRSSRADDKRVALPKVSWAKVAAGSSNSSSASPALAAPAPTPFKRFGEPPRATTPGIGRGASRTRSVDAAPNHRGRSRSNRRAPAEDDWSVPAGNEWTTTGFPAKKAL